jgi:type I restriction enzyme R subunit
MSFNEKNTIENALRDHLVGKPVTVQTGMVAEETSAYIAGNRDLKWNIL